MHNFCEEKASVSDKNIIIIGYKEDIKLVQKVIKRGLKVTSVILKNCRDDANILDADTLNFYDYIIVAIKNKEDSGNMCCLLEAISGYDNSRIINFYSLYRANIPVMMVDRVMKNPLRSQYNGMILGISHAQVGILPKIMDGIFCNLAVSSQDIYYNMKTLEYCINTYRNKVQNLQYLIFDMYDYTYFNYDVSLSERSSTKYYSWGGFTLDAHNFNQIRSFDFNFDELMRLILAKHYENLNMMQLKLWDELFEKVYSYNDYHDFDNYPDAFLRTKIVSDKEIEEFEANVSVVKNYFQHSILENIQHFYHLLDLAYSINPSIRIFCILMPRYCKTWDRIKSEFLIWREVFYTIIGEAQKRYPFILLDFVEDEISKHREWYYDASHFNYYGAIQFSKLLNELISENFG